MSSLLDSPQETRLKALHAERAKRGIDAVLLSKEENKFYCSGFSSSSFDLILAADANYLLTDSRYIEAAQALSPLFQIVEVKRGYQRIDFLKELQPAVLGAELKVMTVDEYRTLTSALPEMELTSFDGVVEKIRSVKSQEELDATRQAEHIGDEAFSYILNVIRPGITEKEVALRLEMKMRELGASGLSFDTICVSGVRTSMPHGIPSDKVIEEGDFVTMDFGCVYEGYCSDMTRTVAVGRVSDRQRLVYDTVLKAQQAAIDTIRSGISAGEVDRAAREVIYAAGFEGCFGHGLGHGTGLEIHEAPSSGPASTEILQKNMLLTIEPGIYLPGEFGVRIEDLSIVTDDGIINLTESEKQLIIL